MTSTIRKINFKADNTLSKQSIQRLKTEYKLKRIDGILKKFPNTDGRVKKRDTKIKKALEKAVEAINIKIEKENEKIKEKEKKDDDKIKKLIKGKTDSIKIDISDAKRLKKIATRLANNDRFILSVGENTAITLTPNNISKMKEYIQQNTTYAEETKDSFSEEIFNIIESGYVKIERVIKIGNSIIQGGWFPYYHVIPDLDLTPYQIYTNKDETKKDGEIPCIIKCFIEAGVDSSIIEQSKRFVKQRGVPQRALKEIAEKYNLYITIKREESNDHLRKYGKSKNKHINIGLLNDHYFLIQKTDITKYSLEHYEELHEKDNWKTFRTHNKRTNHVLLDSYKLIKLILENKDKYLKKISREEMLDTLWFDKVKPITNIDCIDDNVKLVEMKEPLNPDDIVQDTFINVFFDFETTTSGNKHKPYLCRIADDDKEFLGYNSGKQMLQYLVNKYQGQDIRLIAHNAGYDVRFLTNYLISIDLIERGKSLLRGRGMFFYQKGKHIKIQIQDSYAHLPMKLSDFAKTFNLTSYKEILPYDLYNELNVKTRHIPIDECLTFLKIEYVKKEKEMSYEEYEKHYYKNIIEWDCLHEGLVDIIKYSSKYCEMDCKVLKEGYNQFKEWIQEICGLNVDDYVSLPSLANEYFVKEGCFDGVYAVGGIVREFIQKSMNGGRTMCCENKKHFVNKIIDDFDAVSLYPSAMSEREGYLLGKPKVILNPSYDVIKNYDGYFIEIKINKIGKKRKFPLMCKSKEGGIKEWSNDMIDEIIHVDKTSLEDLITFQEVEFEIIRGYYFDEGRNYKLKNTIDYLFNERVKAKENKNPIQNVYKLLMNSSYGKTLLKEFDDETKYLSAYKDMNSGLVEWLENEGVELFMKENKLRKAETFHTAIRSVKYCNEKITKENCLKIYGIGEVISTYIARCPEYIFNKEAKSSEYEKYIDRYYNYIKEIVPIGDRMVKVKTYKATNEHYNYAHAGVEILSMSKRIMNRVMCLAEDHDMNIYYQDTDSMHIDREFIDPLSQLFYEKYNKKLIGKGMGQFHSDFKSSIIKDKNIHAKKSIFLGKKCYLDVLEGLDGKGDIVNDYHIRMKGVGEDVVKYYCKKNEISVESLYEDLYNGEEFTFDLTNDGNKCSFEYKKNLEIISREVFNRRISFK